MIGALTNGISGMNAYQGALTTESNNVANINTVGYKADTVSFADMAYSNGIGTGASAGTVIKNFSQGNLKLTGQEYDLAISGKGFFTVQDPNEAADPITGEIDMQFTRAGNFRVGNDGTLQMPNGFQVQGIQMNTMDPTDPASVYRTDPDATVFTNAYSVSLASKSIESNTQIVTINAKATDYVASATQSGISGTDLKTADAKIADVIALTIAYQEALSSYSSNVDNATAGKAAEQVDTIAYGSYATNLTKEGDYIEVLIDGNTVRQSFDTDAQTTMNLFADKISQVQGLQGSVDTAGNITITSLVPGKSINVTNPKINNIAFLDSVTTGTYDPTVTVTPLENLQAVRTALGNAIESAGGELLDMTNIVDMSTTINPDTNNKEYNSAMSSLQLKLTDLGISDNQFGTAEIDNGILYLKQGQNTFVVGKVTISAFTDQSELTPEGDNVYSKTQSAGSAVIMDGITSVLSGTLELSNSQLSEGLVNLMVYQRAFEANSKLFAAADDFLNIAIQLKK